MAGKTIKSISDGIISQLESSLNQTIPLLEKSFNRVLAKSTASVFVMLEHYNNFMLKQWFVSTCSSDDISVLGVTVNPLNFWGNLIGLDGRKQGVRSESEISVIVEQIGGLLDAGTQLQSAKTGFTYITTQQYTLTSNPMFINVIAADDPSGNNGIGSNGNLLAGDVLSFVNPLAQVGNEATVTQQLVAGANPETAESYRKRVENAFRRRKQGGALIDYEIWGTSVDGISNVYPYTGQPGEVDVYVEATPESSGSPDGIPTPVQLQAVKGAIEFDQNGKASRRPLGTFVNTLPIRRTGFKVVVSGLIVENRSQVEGFITDALTDFFLSAAPFITGLSVPPRRDQISRIAVESVINDVVAANNGTFYQASLFIYTTGSGITTYPLNVGEKAKLTVAEYPA